MSWLVFIRPRFHRSEPLFSPIFQGRRSVCSVLCVCPHIHLLFSVEAQMYILLILFPAVKLQWGIKDPPHSPLRKSLQETHTHTHIHTYTMAGQRPCRKLHRGIPARPEQIISPLTSCSSLPPHLSLPPLSTPHICDCVIYHLRWLYWIEKLLKIGKWTVKPIIWCIV